MLTDLSASRAVQGSSPTETAAFIFSLKTILLKRLAAQSGASNSTAPMIAIAASLFFHQTKQT
jgi:hypothetical protein